MTLDDFKGTKIRGKNNQKMFQQKFQRQSFYVGFLQQGGGDVTVWCLHLCSAHPFSGF